MKKEYTINELAHILGCSRTAIVKKIKEHPTQPGVKMYRDRFEVVLKNGSMVILLDDLDLEHEKSMSKGFKNVSSNTIETAESTNIIDIEPEKENIKSDTFIEFTNRYIEQFATFQKEMYNELKQRDNQILLLTTSEKTKENEYLQTKAENKTLKHRNKVLTVITSVLVTVLIVSITILITSITLSNNDTQKNNLILQEIMKDQAK